MTNLTSLSCLKRRGTLTAVAPRGEFGRALHEFERYLTCVLWLSSGDLQSYSISCPRGFLHNDFATADSQVPPSLSLNSPLAILGAQKTSHMAMSDRVVLCAA